MLKHSLYGTSIYKSFPLILILNLSIACQVHKEGSQIEEFDKTEDIVLSGNIFGEFYNGMTTYAYKLQLIEGHVNYSDWAEHNFLFSDIPVIVSDKSQYYEFHDLHIGDYTICAVRNGFKPFMGYLHIDGRQNKVFKNINMQPDLGFSGRLQILDENANEISNIEFQRGTQSIFLYIFNGTGEMKNINTYVIPEEFYIGKSFIIDGEIKHIYSLWVKEIKKTSDSISANGIMLVEIVIDPLLYMLREHSKCRLIIGNEKEINLSY